MNSSQTSSWSRWDTALALLIVAGAIWLSRLPFQPPNPVGREAPDSAFSAERAMDHLRVIARSPHVPGSPEHRRVREYLIDQLGGLCAEAEYQSTTWLRDLDGTRAVAVWNVLGRIPGSDPSGAVVLIAHYDAVPHSPGVNDNGTGVAVILETLRALGAGPAQKNDLIVLLSDAEELSRMGSRAFVNEHRWFPDASVVLNLDMRGQGGASWMFETGLDNGWIVRAFARADPQPVANSMTLDIYRTMSGFTDYSSFREAGVQGLNFSTVAGWNTYHLSLDNLEHTSPAIMQHLGLHALSLATYLGNADLRDTNAPDVVFATVPVLGLLVYPPLGDWIGVVLAGVLAVVTLVLGLQRRKLRLGGVMVGSGIFSVSLLVSGFVSAELYDWLRGVHPEYRLIQGRNFHREGWYFLCVVLMSWTVLLALFGLFRRWFRLSELAWGGGVMCILGCLPLAIWMPFTTVNLVWPSLFGAGALLWFLYRLEQPPPEQRARSVRLLVLGLILLPVVVFLSPMTEVLWMALGISMAPLFAFMASAALVLLLPLSAPFQAVYGFRAPALLGLLAAVCLVLGAAGARATPDTPTPTRLFYTMDRDEGRAWWATGGRSDIPWIRERVPDTESQDSDGEGDFFPKGYATAAAEPVYVAAPDVDILRDTIQGNRRVVRLSITSSIRAEVLSLSPREGVESRLLAVNDRTLEWSGAEEGQTGWPLSHWGDPGRAVEIEFSIPAHTDAPDMLLREISYRPGRFLGPEAFARPAHLIPSVVGTSDVAVFGTRIVLPRR